MNELFSSMVLRRNRMKHNNLAAKDYHRKNKIDVSSGSPSKERMRD